MRFSIVIYGLFLVLINSTSLFAESNILRHYDFSLVSLESRTLENLAAKDNNDAEKMTYKTKAPIEIVLGPDGKSTVVRVDSGWFETSKFPVTKNGFTVEILLRIIGQGKELGNDGAKNGTIFGMGDGYWSGTRLTLDSAHPQPVFSIGRPQPSNSYNVVSARPIPFGTWLKIAATWNGKFMRIYVDGIPYAKSEYAGDFADANWNFRIGYNNAGVGSFVMDIAELKIHEGVPELLQLLMSGCERLDLSIGENPVQRRNYVELAEKIDENDLNAALNIARNIISRRLENDRERITAEYFEAEILALMGKTAESQGLFERIYNSNASSMTLKDTAIRRCIPQNERTPQITPRLRLFYEKMLELEGLEEQQLKTVRKCIALCTRYYGETETPDQQAEEISEYRKQVAELLSRKYVPDYISHEKAEIALERERLAQGKSPWIAPAEKNPLDTKIKPAITFYVAPDGNAENPGSREKPFGSLQQARDAVRKLRATRKSENKPELPEGGIEIIVRGGNYPVRESFRLEREDSGTENAPIIYRNFEAETPIFSGSIELKNFTKVVDHNILRRLPEESRGKVYCTKISEVGFDHANLPPMNNRGYGANSPNAAPWVDLYIEDVPMQLARFPNEPLGVIDEKTAFMRTGEIISEHKSGIENNKPGIFRYDNDRIDRWAEADDIWLLGYWKHLWAATLIKLDKIDVKAKELTVQTGANPYGYAKNVPFYAINILEEIDVAGEWYLDRKNGIVYVYPPEGVNLNEGKCKIRLSVLSEPQIRCENVSNTIFSGLVFEDGCASGAIIEGGENVVFSSCVFRRFGAWGISMNGTGHGVIGCDVLQLGGGGISMNGGNIRTLIPGGCFIVNNHIAHLSRVDRVYGPAVSLDGVGNRVAHNLMHDSPAHGMRMGGFSHIIEFNEIHSMVYESDDQSGIDMYGNPTLRDNIIRYNYWHHIGSGRDVAGQSGIRLDDMISSVLMYGNVFYRSAGGQFGGIQIHGGKNNVADNNLFIDCKAAFSFSPWGEKRWIEHLERGNFADLVKQSGIDITKEPLRSRYPDYATIRENADRNYILRNLAVRCGTFARNDGGRNVLLDNLALAETEIKFDEHGKPIIPYEWPAYRVIEMRPLPIEKMGLYRDETRKEIPKTEVSKRYVLE